MNFTLVLVLENLVPLIEHLNSNLSNTKIHIIRIQNNSISSKVRREEFRHEEANR